MSQVINEVKPYKDYSLFYIDHFNNIEGELAVTINNEILITFCFTAECYAKRYTDCNGEYACELSDISNIKLDMQQAWTINEDGEVINEVYYEVDDSLTPELKGVIKTLYTSAKIELADEIADDY